MPYKEESHVIVDDKNNLKGIKIHPTSNAMESNNQFIMTTKKLLEKKSKIYPLCIVITILLLVSWLIALTVVREEQIKELRSEINILKEGMDFFKFLLHYDEELIEDIESNTNTASERVKQIIMSLNELSGNEDESDEDDIDDDDDGYDNPDEYYDDNNESLGDGEDFLGEVMEAKLLNRSKQASDDKHPPIKKIMRVFAMDENEDKHNRSRRDVIDETPDGVPVLEEPYLISRAKNLSRHISPENLRRMPEKSTPKMLHSWDSTDPAQHDHLKSRKHFKKYDQHTTESTIPVYTRPSRVMVTNEDNSRAFRRIIRFRRPMTRSGLTSDYDAAALERQPGDASVTRLRRRRKHKADNRASMSLRNAEEILIRSNERSQAASGLLVAHFNGDTNGYQIGHHEHYDGNGRLRHAHDVPYTAWSSASWLAPLGLDTQFTLQDGMVTIPETGIYFVYAQVFFHDEHDTNGYRMYRNNGVKDEVILQCSTMTYSTTRIEKSNTCYTAGAFHLTAGDNLSIKNLGSMRYSIMEPGKSFFGLFKLATSRIK